MLCPLLLSPIILLLTTVIDLANATSGTASSSWKQWSCDELTPNLCELQVESGSVTIQSIPVKYWRYTRRTTNATATATNSNIMTTSNTTTTSIATTPPATNARLVHVTVGPQVILRDLGDDVASWLTKMTGIVGCRLMAIGGGRGGRKGRRRTGDGESGQGLIAGGYHEHVDSDSATNSAMLPDPSERELGEVETEEEEEDEYRRIVLLNTKQGEAVPVPVPLPSASTTATPSCTSANSPSFPPSPPPPPPVSLADEAPFLLTSTVSLDDLNRRLRSRGKPPVEMQRFRPNIVISGNRGVGEQGGRGAKNTGRSRKIKRCPHHHLLRPWEEDTWKRIRIVPAPPSRSSSSSSLASSSFSSSYPSSSQDDVDTDEQPYVNVSQARKQKVAARHQHDKANSGETHDDDTHKAVMGDEAAEETNVRNNSKNINDENEDDQRGCEFLVWQRCGRCVMTTIDPLTLTRGPEPLETLSTFRERDHGQRNFGVHLIPVLPPLACPAKAVNEVWKTAEKKECSNAERSTRKGSETKHKQNMNRKRMRSIGMGYQIQVLEYDEVRLEEWNRLYNSK